MASRGGRSNAVPIQGTVAPGFETVRDAFRRNFTERGERGAACSIYHRGEKVVDLWGGYRDEDDAEEWTEDTLVLVFSTTKGMAATAVALAQDRGLFDYDDYVVDHWREFGRYGKHGITVRELLAHQAGLATVDESLTPEMVDDRESLMKLLANKRPDWTPGMHHGYHAWTLGWYESELIRQTDPQGRTLDEFFDDEVADPLDLDFHIGQPDHVPDDRVADLTWFHPRRMLQDLGELPGGFLAGVVNPFSDLHRSLNPFRMLMPSDVDNPEYRNAVMPAASGIGTARDLAKVYGDMATGGSGMGMSDDTLSELTASPTPPIEGREDVILKIDASYSLGFCRPLPSFQFGSMESFGHQGAGGSMAFADPINELSFAYTPNMMGSLIFDDPRERALRTAMYDCVEGL